MKSDMSFQEHAQSFVGKAGDKTLKVGVVGLGYVGLPLIMAFHRAGLPVLGVDIDAGKIRKLREGENYIEHLDSDTPRGRRRYSRGILGPGFRSARPCVVHWAERPDRPEMRNPVCTATGFAVRCPDPAPLNKVFEALGLTLRATEGEQQLTLELDTPKGPVTFSGPGLTFEGFGAILAIARLRVRHLLGRNR